MEEIKSKTPQKPKAEKKGKNKKNKKNSLLPITVILAVCTMILLILCAAMAFFVGTGRSINDIKKINIEESSKINENNVLDYLGSVYCYVQLINDFNENVLMKKELKQNMNMSSLVNKSIENLDKEIKFKLLKFNYKNCMKKVKNDKKQNSMFDDVIRRLANEIVKDVNDNYDVNEDTIVCTNVTSHAKNTKKQNTINENI